MLLKDYIKRFSDEIHFKYPETPILGRANPSGLSEYKDCILGINSQELEKLSSIVCFLSYC